MGSVSCARLSAGAFLTCLTHALSNESEEVMGLCIGETAEKVESYAFVYCLIHLRNQ